MTASLRRRKLSYAKTSGAPRDRRGRNGKLVTAKRGRAPFRNCHDDKSRRYRISWWRVSKHLRAAENYIFPGYGYGRKRACENVREVEREDSKVRRGQLPAIDTRAFVDFSVYSSRERMPQLCHTRSANNVPAHVPREKSARIRDQALGQRNEISLSRTAKRFLAGSSFMPYNFESDRLSPKCEY